VFVHENLLARRPQGPVPTMLRYTTHAESNSLYNTPNTFGIMVLQFVLDWLRGEGGVQSVGDRNARKAGKLYELLDSSSLYKPHARAGSRSTMNVTWTLEGRDAQEIERRTADFLEGAALAGMSGLKGHRSVGGCRASIYNAFPMEGVEYLCEFMEEFERRA
jgi:phosphoserine aminotransferase